MSTRAEPHLLSPSLGLCAWVADRAPRETAVVEGVSAWSALGYSSSVDAGMLRRWVLSVYVGQLSILASGVGPGLGPVSQAGQPKRGQT